MKGIGFACREELHKEHHGALGPRVNNFLVLVDPLFCPPLKGDGNKRSLITFDATPSMTTVLHNSRSVGDVRRHPR
jgi:hypothetical protein